MPPAVPDSGEFAIKSPMDQRASTSVGDLCRPSLAVSGPRWSAGKNCRHEALAEEVAHRRRLAYLVRGIPISARGGQLSLRMIEEMLAARSIEATYETVRRCVEVRAAIRIRTLGLARGYKWHQEVFQTKARSAKAAAGRVHPGGVRPTPIFFCYSSLGPCVGAELRAGSRLTLPHIVRQAGLWTVRIR